MTTGSNGGTTNEDKVDRQHETHNQQPSMVRMSGSNLYGSTSSAASRSRRASSGEKASLVKSDTTASTGEANASKTVVHIPVPPYQAGAESNNSVRSTGSGSTSSRKLQRSFRRTKMFQRNKRNSNDVIAKSQISVVSQTSDTDQSTSDRSPNRFHSHNSASRGNVVANSTVEEREAGADSPTFPPSKQTSPAHTESQKQSPEESQIPQGHIDNILRFYGGDDMSSASLDLYRDVLKVSPDASDREIRIAYFRRGREILGDSSAKPDDATLDPKMKARFQAVSMAFEILSTPSWKETYLQEGLRRSASMDIPNMNAMAHVDPFSSPPSTVAAAFRKTNNDNIGMQKTELKQPPVSSKPKIDVAQKRRNQRQMLQKLTPTLPPVTAPKKTPTMPLVTAPTMPPTMPPAMPPALPLPALRKSSFTKGSTSPRTTRSPVQRSSSVRWKDHVEELVFENHPNEHAYEDSDSDYESNDEDDVLEEDEIAERERIRKNTLQNTFGNSGGKQANGKMNKSNGASSGSKKRKKNKPRIVIDSEELESHLQLIDDEAEKHFVKDFWDNFEESMDGILSLVDSIGGGDASKKVSTKKPSRLPPPTQSSRSKQRNVPRGNRDETDSTIKRSLSHDATVSPKTKVVIDYNSEELMKRSNSFPRSSPSSLDAISPLDEISPSTQAFDFNQSGSTTARVVSPDEKGIKAKLSPVRVVTSPAIVSPSPTSKSKTSFNKKDAASTDQDTTMSLASTIFSNSQGQQQFFRPISPDASEASEVDTSDFLPASFKKKNAPKGTVPITESDQFDMESRLSGMESVDLAALENPFRSKDPSPPNSANTDVANVGESKNVSSKGEEKKNRFKVSMTSNVRGSPVDKEVSSCTGSSNFDQSVEDVFAGVDEDSPLERYDMPGGDIAIIKRSTSTMSDLSESVISARKENEVDGEAVNPGVPALNEPVEKPAMNSETVTLETSSVLSASTKKSLAERSQASSACSTYASTESKGLENLEDAGFFEYFMAYVSAVMTECANVGATAVGEEYHQDFLTLFSNDACVHPTAEIREQPTSTRQPSVSTKSTSTF